MESPQGSYARKHDIARSLASTEGSNHSNSNNSGISYNTLFISAGVCALSLLAYAMWRSYRNKQELD